MDHGFDRQLEGEVTRAEMADGIRNAKRAVMVVEGLDGKWYVQWVNLRRSDLTYAYCLLATDVDNAMRGHWDEKQDDPV